MMGAALIILLFAGGCGLSDLSGGLVGLHGHGTHPSLRPRAITRMIGRLWSLIEDHGNSANVG